MRRFMKDKRRPVYVVALGRLGRKNDRLLANERRPRVLHPAKRNLRYQYQFKFWKREFEIEKFLEILNVLAHQSKRLGSMRLELSGLGFSDVNKPLTPV